jgi:hypothetical protein
VEHPTTDLPRPTDPLTLAVRPAADGTHPLERRLAELTDRCADILTRWAASDERHQHAISELEGRLTEWSAIENRLEQDSQHRIQEFERSLERDWAALRAAQDEPVKQLREQAAALGETCAAAASLALRGFERAEARMAALETEVQHRLTQLSADVQAALAELRRQQHAPALGTGATPFALDEVMRIHDELRAETTQTGPTRPALAAAPVGTAPAPAAEASTPTATPAPVTSPRAAEPLALAADASTASPTASPVRDRRFLFVVVGIAAVLLLGAGALVRHGINTRLDAAAARVSAAERQATAAAAAASRQIAASRSDAERQMAETRRAAENAQIVGNVLAAPDLVRFNVVGSDPATRAYGQLLWSRSTGFVVTASRLAAAPAGSAYHIWLLTAGDAVAAGTLTPDASGRATFATDTVPDVPRVTGVMVTLGSAAGHESSPTGAVVLARPQQP